MNGSKNSNLTRYNVDVQSLKEEIERAAIEDSVSTGQLKNVAIFTREIITAFLAIRSQQRELGVPLQTPESIARDYMATEAVASLP